MDPTKPETTQYPIASDSEKPPTPTMEEVLKAMRDLEQIILAYPVGERTPEEDEDIEIITKEVEKMQRLLNERRAQFGIAPLGEAEQATVDYRDKNLSPTTPEVEARLNESR